MFRIGQKVVCVNAAPDKGRTFPHGKELVLSAIYTVQSTGLRGPYDFSSCIALTEIPDWQYRVTRFRPVVDRKTDISIFTEMLKPQPVKALTAVTAGQPPRSEK